MPPKRVTSFGQKRAARIMRAVGKVESLPEQQHTTERRTPRQVVEGAWFKNEYGVDIEPFEIVHIVATEIVGGVIYYKCELSHTPVDSSRENVHLAVNAGLKVKAGDYGLLQTGQFLEVTINTDTRNLWANNDAPEPHYGQPMGFESGKDLTVYGYGFRFVGFNPEIKEPAHFSDYETCIVERDLCPLIPAKAGETIAAGAEGFVWLYNEYASNETDRWHADNENAVAWHIVNDASTAIPEDTKLYFQRVGDRWRVNPAFLCLE